MKEQAVVLVFVDDPALDRAGPEPHLVDVDERIVVHAPRRPVDLDHFAAAIFDRLLITDDDAVDQRREGLAVGGGRHRVLARHGLLVRHVRPFNHTTGRRPVLAPLLAPVFFARDQVLLEEVRIDVEAQSWPRRDREMAVANLWRM